MGLPNAVPCPVAVLSTNSCPGPTCACVSVPRRPTHGLALLADIREREGVDIQLCAVHHGVCTMSTASTAAAEDACLDPPYTASARMAAMRESTVHGGRVAADVADTTRPRSARFRRVGLALHRQKRRIPLTAEVQLLDLRREGLQGITRLSF